MANNYYGTSPAEGKELAYDLRQILAYQLGEIRKELLIARYEKNYPKWYGLIDSLYIEVENKLEDDEKKTYNDLLKDLNKSINESPQAYNNKDSDLILDANKIYGGLKTLNIWMNKVMNKYDMFGSKDFDEGL